MIETRAPVFIVGVHRRCGSNFLADALRLSGVFGQPNPISEDYLLHSGHLARRYIEETTEKWWKKRFDQQAEFQKCKQSFYATIGNGMLDMLVNRIDEGKRLLTKTPDPDNVSLFFDLFPNAQLILIVRDGRDIVESSYKSWPSEPRKHWMKMWARGAQEIIDFINGPGQAYSDRWRLVRYEDFFSGQDQMRDLLQFLNVDADAFPWNDLDNLSIRGSAVYRGGRDEVHWDTVEKPKDFKPSGRWNDWGWWTCHQFERLAGSQNRSLGYGNGTPNKVTKQV